MKTPNWMPPGTIHHRADVDGLRALAVLLVFVNHASEEWLPSGYVGVDVFFVISGFVVTASILRGAHGAGVPGILEFWRRRIIRIIPALFVFVALTSVFFAAFFSINTEPQYLATLRTGLASLFGLSNYFLIHTSNDYFLADSSVNIFLHTWSLGVEEQFYLISAPFIFILLWIFKGRVSVLMLVFFVVGGASLSAFLWTAVRDPTLAYYSIHTRFWEIAAGGCLALFVAKARPSKANGGYWVASIALVGLLAILVASLWPHQPDGFVGPIVLAVIGAVALIGAGSLAHNPISQLFSLTPVVAVGLLSYSIYLYHWPVLVFLRWNIGLGAVTTFVAFGVTLLLAWVSYRFVETLARRSKLPLFSRIVPMLAFALAIVGGGSILLAQHQGALHVGSAYAKNDWLPGKDFAYGGAGRLKASDCLLQNGASVRESVPKACIVERNVESNTSSVLLVGDSHAFSQFALIGDLGTKTSLRTAAYVHDGCSWTNPTTLSLVASCRAYLEALPSISERFLGQGDVLFVANFFDLQKPVSSIYQNRLRELAKIVEAKKGHIVIELPHIRSVVAGIHCVDHWFRRVRSECIQSLADVEANRQATVEHLRAFARDMGPVVQLWDPVLDLCKGSVCPVVDGVNPVLRDKNHLAAAASRRLRAPFQRLLEQLGQT